jgi:hypothetical protein
MQGARLFRTSFPSTQTSHLNREDAEDPRSFQGSAVRMRGAWDHSARASCPGPIRYVVLCGLCALCGWYPMAAALGRDVTGLFQGPNLRVAESVPRTRPSSYASGSAVACATSIGNTALHRLSRRSRSRDRLTAKRSVLWSCSGRRLSWVLGAMAVSNFGLEYIYAPADQSIPRRATFPGKEGLRPLALSGYSNELRRCI